MSSNMQPKRRDAMSTPKMPGFTAEASLCQVSERYAIARPLVATADGRRILPQLCYQDSDGYICCWSWMLGVWKCRLPGGLQLR
jgi:hypothetical protein